MNLANKAVHGIGWVSFFSLTTRGVRFLTTLVLARLLVPADFGLVAIGLLVVNTLAMFRDLGIGAALVYQKEDIDKAANTSFVMFTFMGLALFSISYMSSPLMAVFFNSPESGLVIRYLSITLFLTCLGTTSAALLDRELNFKKQAYPEIGSILVYAGIAISLAYMGFGVWGIVWGKIASEFAWLGIIWLVTSWRPKLEFDYAVAKRMLGYGKHILGASLIFFFLSNIDSGFVGKLSGVTALGFYAIAFNVSNLPALNITQLVNRVMFPTFSKLQDDRETLVRVYLKTLRYISILSVPSSFGILLVAPELIRVALGEKWMPSLLTLQILCIAGLLRSIRASTFQVFNALGKPDIPAKFALYELIMLSVLAYPLTGYYGIVGTGVAVVIPVFIFTVWGYKLIGGMMGINWLEFADALKAPFAASLGMTAVILLIRPLLPEGDLLRLAALAGVGAVSYALIIYFLNRKILVELKWLLSNLRPMPAKLPQE